MNAKDPRNSPERVLARTGTDGSYDLIVEVIRAPNGPLVDHRGEAGVGPERLARTLRALEARFGERIAASGLGLRLCLFRRLPDEFVINARVAAALGAVEHQQLDAAK